jgi:bacteriocin-like protein
MANIQRTDHNPSELGIMEEVEELTSEELLDEELTDEELSSIDGGSFWRSLNKTFNRAVGLAVDITGINS